VSLKNIVRLIYSSVKADGDSRLCNGGDDLNNGGKRSYGGETHQYSSSDDSNGDGDHSYNSGGRYPAPFSQIRSEIQSGCFRIAPPDKLFKSWEQQGVLLLNKYLTCECNKPGSHRDIWRRFTSGTIKYLSHNNPDIAWMLWGEDAKTSKPDIMGGKIFFCRHPMMCSSKYDDDFLKSDCFLATKSIIDWTGIITQ
jgi:uracil DNA glycosylase